MAGEAKFGPGVAVDPFWPYNDMPDEGIHCSALVPPKMEGAPLVCGLVAPKVKHPAELGAAGTLLMVAGIAAVAPGVVAAEKLNAGKDDGTCAAQFQEEL